MGKKERNGQWLPKKDACLFVGITLTLFDRDIRQQLPPTAIEKDGRSVFVFGPDLVELLRERRARDANRTSDSEMQAVKLIKAKADAKKAELESLQREGKLVDVDQVRRAYQVVASHLRRATDELSVTFGEGAREVLEDALNDAERALEKGIE